MQLSLGLPLDAHQPWTHLLFYQGPLLGAPAIVWVVGHGGGTTKITELDSPLVAE